MSALVHVAGLVSEGTQRCERCDYVLAQAPFRFWPIGAAVGVFNGPGVTFNAVLDAPVKVFGPGEEIAPCVPAGALQ
jgi:hypothetical protein